MFTAQTVETTLQILINGILYGSLYGVAAIGLSLIFGSMQIIFIAQGSFMILSAYFTYYLFTLLGLDPLFAFVLGLPVFFGLGGVLYRYFFSRVSLAGKNPTLLLAFGLMVLLENLMSLGFSPNTKTITTFYTAVAFSLGNIQISYSRLIVSVVSFIATGLVFAFLKTTMWGKAVRGSSEDARAGALLGISPMKVATLTFAIGISLAGVAGVAVATTYPFDPYFGFLFSLKALIAVALGGMGNVAGAMIGGVLLGVVESIGSYTISSGWADAISYLAFLIVLIFRPEGLFSRTICKA